MFHVIIIPLVYTISLILSLMLFIIYFLEIQKHGYIYFVHITILIAAMFGYMFTIINIVNIMFEKRFKVEFKTIAMFIVFVFSLALIHIRFYSIGGYLFMAFIIFYNFYIVKKSLKPKQQEQE